MTGRDGAIFASSGEAGQDDAAVVVPKQQTGPDEEAERSSDKGEG
jgi:hypothetical protein